MGGHRPGQAKEGQNAKQADEPQCDHESRTLVARLAKRKPSDGQRNSSAVQGLSRPAVPARIFFTASAETAGPPAKLFPDVRQHSGNLVVAQPSHSWHRHCVPRPVFLAGHGYRPGQPVEDHLDQRSGSPLTHSLPASGGYTPGRPFPSG